MLVTLLGIVTLVRLLQSIERPDSDAGDTVANRDAGQAAQSKNASSPMLVTLLGIVTLVRRAVVERIAPDAGDRWANSDVGQARSS